MSRTRLDIGYSKKLVLLYFPALLAIALAPTLGLAFSAFLWAVAGFGGLSTMTILFATVGVLVTVVLWRVVPSMYRASRVGAYVDGPRLVARYSRRVVTYDLSTAETRLGSQPIVSVAQARKQRGAHGPPAPAVPSEEASEPASSPTDHRPVLYLRPQGEHRWRGMALHNVEGVVLPARQLEALAAALLSYGRGAADGTARETADGLRSLAATPYPYATGGIRVWTPQDSEVP